MSAILAAVIPATSAIVVAVLAAWVNLRKGQKEIHVLVNNRLTEALEEIKRLGGDAKEF